MRVLLCDDDRMLRDLLAVLLPERGHDVVGSVGDFADAVHLLHRTPVDVVLLDVRLAGPADLAAVVGLGGRARPRVLLVCDAHDPCVAPHDAQSRSLADGVLDRTQDLATWVHALAGASSADHRPRRTRRRHRDPLTPRERDVLDRMVAGLSTAAMAADLGVSSSTVQSHVQSVLRKLGVNSRLAAVSAHLRGAPTSSTAAPGAEHEPALVRAWT